MKFIVPIALGMSLILNGCASAPVGSSAEASKASPDPALDPNYKRPSDQEAIKAAENAIRAKLKDPESARFSDMIRKTTANARGEPTDVVCGRVNAKNGFGGYTGFTPAVYLVSRKVAYTTEEPYVGPDILRLFCGN
jgi:hypothetical protein